MATFKLKNNSQESGTVPGVGVYVDGVLNNAPDNFENPNFERVTEESAQAPAVPIAPVAPAASQAPIASAPNPIQSNPAARTGVPQVDPQQLKAPQGGVN